MWVIVPVLQLRLHPSSGATVSDSCTAAVRRRRLPIAGDLDGPILEGWTLLSALAAQTERLRLGVLVTSNRFRPPAMLAKIAATVDVVSGGRLDFGIGAGSRPSWVCLAPIRKRSRSGSPTSSSQLAVLARTADRNEA
jgi:hypothetical protein